MLSCFPCFANKTASFKKGDSPLAHANTSLHPVDASNGNSTTKTFTFRELAMATNNFRQECLLGEGAFGRIFRGTLQSSGQIVAVRQLDRSGTQGSKEFQVEVLVLSLLRHPNLINMVGYCADGDQRLLVYEYMPAGSLTKHLFDIPENQKPLDWATRMKIAAGIAQGLEYLHEKANPPVIYRDLKSSNILLDDVNNPKLSDYGLTKLVLSGNKMHLSPTMASYGYSAPEYENHGELTLKSDVYSFGVVLLELITGRKAVDPTQPKDEQNLVIWAQPFFRDPKKFPDMADSILNKEFPVTSLNQAVGVAAMCLTEEPMVRPMIGDVVAALSFLASPPPPDAPMNPPTPLAPILSKRAENTSQHGTIDQENISSHHHKNVDSTSAKGHRNEHEYENDNKEEGYDGSMDFKYVETSDSEHEDRTGISYSVQTKSQNIDSAVSSWRSNRTSSFGYSSRGFSLRCESINRERDVNSHSNLDNEQFCDDYHASSSGDEEPTSVPVSRHVSRDRSASITSRRSSGSFMR